MNVWMTSLVVCLILPFDPHTTTACVNRSHLCPLSPKQTVNHPYMFPDEAPWTEDYHELKALRQRHNPENDDHSRYWCDENILEMEDALFFCV